MENEQRKSNLDDGRSKSNHVSDVDSEGTLSYTRMNLVEKRENVVIYHDHHLEMLLTIKLRNDKKMIEQYKIPAWPHILPHLPIGPFHENVWQIDRNT